ncbi:MFS transporter [Staphylococcus warneri]|uniref:MFS transporter n=5 Tax=Staphylococcus TaxID=1279 RepID=A0A364UPG6_STAWA|nr:MULTISPECIES: MFS transporter [Staphylococcus]AGC89540.1 chloramphenicol resistance protein YfhI [Staphylococcus warneri SG1]MCR4455666.1 MFS transporter [Aeromonas salmonicida]QAV30644.1 MFS transporter [Sulfitobacter donghicola]COP97022.1 major facilitator superfamily protein [Streptococcus pneumoniae]AGZ25491.1 MFS family major facilitator transporter [Staphylococcus pasteuri SP1]
MRENKMMFFIFMLGTFTVGMAEYVVTGLLTQISDDMHVSISSAGLLVSVYAISVAVIGPFMRIFTMKVHAHRLLPVLVAIFIVSNLVGMLAPNFNVLLLSRLMSAAMHAPFFGVCMSVAAAVAPPAKKPQAIALVQAGLTIAVMIGVPFGSFLGGLANWRVVFGIMIILAVITMLGMMKFTPHVSLSAEANISKELTVFKNPHILIVISIIVFGYSGVFTTYTFMEPMIHDYAPFKIIGLTVCLFLFGLGGVIGNLVTGSVPEHALTKYLFYTFFLLFITIILFVTFVHYAVLALLICFLFGFGTFGTTPLLNSKIILSAHEAPLLASTLAASIFNVANFIGAILGSILLSIGLPYMTITFISGGIIILGIILNTVNNVYEKKHIQFHN